MKHFNTIGGTRTKNEFITQNNFNTFGFYQKQFEQ